jgi:hypothetical protein
MKDFSSTHNIGKQPNFRSLSGYAGQELVLGRLMLCGFNVLRSLWRDSKYDGMFEVNNHPIKIEIKSTKNDNFTVTSGARAGRQIRRSVESRERILQTNDADFFFGVSTRDGTCWMIPVEFIAICKRRDYPFQYIEKFKEKFKIFLGFEEYGINTNDIKSGFLGKSEDQLETLCKKNKIEISNSDKINKFVYSKEKLFGNTRSQSKTIVSYKESLVLDIWIFLYNCA